MSMTSRFPSPFFTSTENRRNGNNYFQQHGLKTGAAFHDEMDYWALDQQKNYKENHFIVKPLIFAYLNET